MICGWSGTVSGNPMAFSMARTTPVFFATPPVMITRGAMPALATAAVVVVVAAVAWMGVTLRVVTTALCLPSSSSTGGVRMMRHGHATQRAAAVVCIVVEVKAVQVRAGGEFHFPVEQRVQGLQQLQHL